MEPLRGVDFKGLSSMRESSGIPFCHGSLLSQSRKRRDSDRKGVLQEWREAARIIRAKLIAWLAVSEV